MSRKLLQIVTLGLLCVGVLSINLPLVFADDPKEEARKIEITLGEFYFQVEGAEKNAPITLKVGETVILEFKNRGAIMHEAMIGRDVKTEDGRPHGYKENLLEGVKVLLEHKMQIGDTERKFEIEAESFEELEVEPDMEVELKFTVPDRMGEWELACFVMGHYEAGQRAKIIVTP